MLGRSEFALRQGFACGKTLVRRKGAASQKAGWMFLKKIANDLRGFGLSPLAIKITTPKGVVIFMDTVRTSHARRK